MLYEFALTPELFDASVVNTDNAGTILVQLLRGIEENGLLADLNRSRWSRYIGERIETPPQVLRDKVMACLKIIEDRHRLVRHPKCVSGNPGTNLDWLNLALESHQKIPFHAIILSQALMESCGQENSSFVEFLRSLDSAQWESRRIRTLTLTKSLADYRAALAPILRHARSLALIDPWLNSQESRYFNTVTICSNMMGQRGHARLQGRIHIHAEAGQQKPYNRTLTDYLNAWEQKLRILIAADGHRFKVFLWESLPGSQSLHDRFILTDQCGISAPGGLDCRSHSHANSTDWSLLDEDVRQQRLNDYDPLLSPFKLLGDREIL